MTFELRSLVWGLGAVALVACNGKDEADSDTDLDTDADADADADADTDTDTDTDTQTTDTDTALPVTERTDVIPLSPTGIDALYAVVAHPDGGFVAAGVWTPTPDATADREMVVARFTDAGDLDAAFGTGGVFRINVVAAGAGELARGVAVQSTGHIVFAGAVEADPTAQGLAVNDRNVAVVRLNPDGTLDSGFGDGGVTLLDMGKGMEVVDDLGVASWAGADAFWWLGVTATDEIVVSGATRSPAGGERTDTDFAVFRLTPTGMPDAAFGKKGLFTLDIEQANASGRNAFVLADGAILVGGYANTPSFGTVQPVLFKVTPDGDLDQTFADDGVFHDEVLAEAAEIYAITVVGGQIVTAGYGRSSEFDSLDWLSLRFDADGKRDFTWGSSGVLQVDVNGFTDQARNIVALPDGRALIVGAGSLADTFLDGAFGVTEADGTLASPGAVLHDFGGISDMMWSAAVSNDERAVAIVGVRGVGSTQTDVANDDATLWLLNVPQ